MLTLTLPLCSVYPTPQPPGFSKPLIITTPHSAHIYSTRNTYLKKTSIGWIMRPISALAAVSTLSKYISDLDEPFARKLEVVLTSFSRQTRLDASNSLQSTTLTDFFAFQAS